MVVWMVFPFIYAPSPFVSSDLSLLAVSHVRIAPPEKLAVPPTHRRELCTHPQLIQFTVVSRCRLVLFF